MSPVKPSLLSQISVRENTIPLSSTRSIVGDSSRVASWNEKELPSGEPERRERDEQEEIESAEIGGELSVVRFRSRRSRGKERALDILALTEALKRKLPEEQHNKEEEEVNSRGKKKRRRQNNKVPTQRGKLVITPQAEEDEESSEGEMDLEVMAALEEEVKYVFGAVDDSLKLLEKEENDPDLEQPQSAEQQASLPQSSVEVPTRRPRSRPGSYTAKRGQLHKEKNVQVHSQEKTTKCTRKRSSEIRQGDKSSDASLGRQKSLARRPEASRGVSNTCPEDMGSDSSQDNAAVVNSVLPMNVPVRSQKDSSLSETFTAASTVSVDHTMNNVHYTVERVDEASASAVSIDGATKDVRLRVERVDEANGQGTAEDTEAWLDSAALEDVSSILQHALGADYKEKVRNLKF